MPKLAVAMLSHEGNSFSPVPTRLADFENAVWCAGAEAVSAYAGTGSEIGGAIAFGAAHPDWELQFLRLAQATPGGPLEPSLFDAIVDEIVAGLKAERVDAVYLVLHGAMMVDGRDMADLALIKRVRAAIGPDTALGVSFDLHANLDPEIMQLVDFASGYKTHPHIDQRETALRVLEVLARIVAGEIRPFGAIAKARSILPSINMRTDAGPMAELEALAQAMLGDGVLDAVPFGGFAYGDTAAAGAAAMVFADNAARAIAVADQLRDQIDERRDAFFTPLPDAHAGLAAALQAVAAGHAPVALVDAADNPLSGGIADTPGLLRTLLEAAPEVKTLMLYFCDPVLVAQAETAGIDGQISGLLGGRLSALFGAPVPFSARVVTLADGRLAATPPMLCGPWIDFGRLALVRLENSAVHVVLSSHIASPHDPALLAALGLDLADFDLLCIKAKNHFRAAYAGRFGAIIPCDTPGPAALDIASFPFERAPRHLYPLCKDAAR